MQPSPADFESIRHKLDLLRDNNSRLRENLERERSRLLNFQKGSDGAGDSGDLRKRLEELTPRELQVLQRIAQGESTKEVAAHLGITFKTAACHRHRLMQKLDVHGTGALVRIAIAAHVVKV